MPPVLPRRVPIAVVVLLLATPAAACGPGTGGDAGPAATDAPTTAPAAGDPVARTDTSGGELFVVHGADATAAPDGDRWTLTVTVTEDVLAFDDRPHRGAAHQGVAELVAAWPELFTGDPPNAALSARTPEGDALDLAVELTDPHWDPDTDQLTITVAPIGDDRATPLPTRLADTSLFIDDAQNTIQVNLVNLTQVPLEIVSATPDISTWSSSQSPTMGFDFGAGSANGPSLDLGYTNMTPGVAFTAQLLLEGDYANQWQLALAWDPAGNPSATLTQLGGQGLSVMGQAAEQGVPLALTDLDPDDGQTAVYQVVLARSPS